MAFTDIKIPKRLIQYSGGDFEVRGLSYNDLASIFTSHKDVIIGLFVGNTEVDTASALADIKSWIPKLMKDAPEVVAELIASAANGPIEIARSIAFPVQTEALEAIFSLTFESEGGLKKFVETIVRISNSAKDSVKTLKE